MLNGRYDFFVPLESTQNPFYNYSARRRTRRNTCSSTPAHNIPRNELIKQTLDWLDQYLGPVN
jgi:eukaryotic-like serine/threonine-protein kinase